ncbi:hypothetical protein E2C01_018787 [Portunus trituberculatus]|uniref:Uncharacterized protein n=1 Tax=Portunus trituberculatus TaxID=210409 RepID=A0A5B7DXF8_PORTR|nr:hypothetical protein [Portunus trituberculatus]
MLISDGAWRSHLAQVAGDVHNGIDEELLVHEVAGVLLCLLDGGGGQHPAQGITPPRRHLPLILHTDQEDDGGGGGGEVVCRHHPFLEVCDAPRPHTAITTALFGTHNGGGDRRGAGLNITCWHKKACILKHFCASSLLFLKGSD